MVSFSGTYLPEVPVNTSATKEGLARKTLDLARAGHGQLVLRASSSMPRMAMMSRSSL